MTPTTLTGLPLWLALIAAVLWLVYVGLYVVLARPWRSRAGRVLLTTALTSAAVLALIGTTNVLGAYPGRDAARTLVYGGACLGALSMTALLLRVQLHDRRRGGHYDGPERRRRL